MFDDDNEQELCPCCGAPLTHKEYYDRDIHATVETSNTCSAHCGFSYGTAYGSRELELPDGWHESTDGEIVRDDDEEYDGECWECGSGAHLKVYDGHGYCNECYEMVKQDE